jgi:hypothetical protein
VGGPCILPGSTRLPPLLRCVTAGGQGNDVDAGPGLTRAAYPGPLPDHTSYAWLGEPGGCELLVARLGPPAQAAMCRFGPGGKTSVAGRTQQPSAERAGADAGDTRQC